jgi:hypothetical protein
LHAAFIAYFFISLTFLNIWISILFFKTSILQVLKDEEKRAKYDEGGLEGLEGGDMPEGADDLFSALFGGRRRGGGKPAGPRKGPDVKHPLKVKQEGPHCPPMFLFCQNYAAYSKS